MKMMLGVWNPIDKKTQEEVESGKKQILFGVEVNQLFDLINGLEVKHSGAAVNVLTELKANCMIALGKLELPVEEKGGEGSVQQPK